MIDQTSLFHFGFNAAVADTRRQLHALSDHQLRDIGIERDQIGSIARRLAGQRPAPRRWRFSLRALGLMPLKRAIPAN